jgi:hypothetical protein
MVGSNPQVYITNIQPNDLPELGVPGMRKALSLQSTSDHSSAAPDLEEHRPDLFDHVFLLSSSALQLRSMTWIRNPGELFNYPCVYLH